jgi:hypothetical protein
VTVVVPARRFACRGCGAVITVVPREVTRRRLFSSLAMGFAVGLYGLVGRSAKGVRAAVSPWRFVGASGAERWRTLERWLAAIAEGDVFGLRLPRRWSPRETAERAARLFLDWVPRGADEVALEHRVALGAVRVAMAIVR